MKEILNVRNVKIYRAKSFPTAFDKLQQEIQNKDAIGKSRGTIKNITEIINAAKYLVLMDILIFYYGFQKTEKFVQ